MTGSVLVVLDAARVERDADRLLDASLRMARRHGGRLRVLTAVRPPSLTLSLAPMAMPWTPEQLWAQAASQADTWCRGLVDRFPADLGIERVTARGRPEHLVAAAIDAGEVAAVAIEGRLFDRRAVRRAAHRWCRQGVDVEAIW